MLTVLPIQDKNEQKDLTAICGIEFDANAFAYRADDGDFLGDIQFKFTNGIG